MLRKSSIIASIISNRNSNAVQEVSAFNNKIAHLK